MSSETVTVSSESNTISREGDMYHARKDITIYNYVVSILNATFTRGAFTMNRMTFTI
jgi:hypothetical protein